MWERPPVSPWMSTAPEGCPASVVISAEGARLAAEEIELWNVERPVSFIGVLPDKKYLVNGIQGVKLNLVIGIATIDKFLDVAVPVADGVHLGGAARLAAAALLGGGT